VLALEIARETGGRAAHEHNLHLTLAFLGSLPGRRIAELEPIGRETARVAAPFALTLDLLGAFREAGVAWAGPQAIPAELQQMFETLRAALQAAHLPTERRAFHPHVTLVRRCRRGLAPRAMAPLAWQVDALTLMGSDTLPDGPHYRELASWPLAGPGALP
jgi:2'-5' RNA ligase